MAGCPAVGRTSVAKPMVAMSLARWSAAFLQSCTKAGSAEIDSIRNNANNRSRLLSKSASTRSRTAVSCNALDIPLFLLLAGFRLRFLRPARGRAGRYFIERMQDVPHQAQGNHDGGREVVAVGLQILRKNRERQTHQSAGKRERQPGPEPHFGPRIIGCAMHQNRNRKEQPQEVVLPSQR